MGLMWPMIELSNIYHGKQHRKAFVPRNLLFELRDVGEITDGPPLLKKGDRPNFHHQLDVDIVFNHMAHRPDDNLDFPGDPFLARYKSDIQFKEIKIFGCLSENFYQGS